MINNEDLQYTHSWTHVSNGMPEPGERVLCYGQRAKEPIILILDEHFLDAESPLSCYWCESKGRGAVAHPYNKDGTPSSKDISHWMHLPLTP